MEAPEDSRSILRPPATEKIACIKSSKTFGGDSCRKKPQQVGPLWSSWHKGRNNYIWKRRLMGFLAFTLNEIIGVTDVLRPTASLFRVRSKSLEFFFLYIWEGQAVPFRLTQH